MILYERKQHQVQERRIDTSTSLPFAFCHRRRLPKTKLRRMDPPPQALAVPERTAAADEAQIAAPAPRALDPERSKSTARGSTRNKCIASSNKCLTSSNKKLVETIISIGRPHRLTPWKKLDQRVWCLTIKIHNLPHVVCFFFL